MLALDDNQPVPAPELRLLWQAVGETRVWSEQQNDQLVEHLALAGSVDGENFVSHFAGLLSNTTTEEFDQVVGQFKVAIRVFQAKDSSNSSFVTSTVPSFIT